MGSAGPSGASGVVTFLFTDIEGSTKLWDQDARAMSEDLERHDALLRDVIGHHGGHIFATGGDGFAAAFSDASAAVASAVDAQRRLAFVSWATTGLRVRMAIHSGSAWERDGDYFGPPVNRCARLMGAAHGGQVVASEVTRRLAEKVGQISWLDLGEHSLKDLAEPEHVYQLSAAGLGSEFPPLRTLDLRPNNLPSAISSFVGRRDEVAAVKRLLGERRLVTVTGAGGVGKTRLAVEAAAQIAHDFADGAWQVELGSITDPALVETEMLGQLRLRLPISKRPRAALVDALTSREMLMVVDNCEHVIEEVAATVRAVLESSPGVRVLATSRVSLGVAGEAVYRLPPLAVGDGGDRPLAYDAVRLFIERASIARPNDTDLELIERICRRIDGLPLAIELAVARLRSMSLVDLEARLQDRFRLLTGGDRTAIPHHRTLLATVQWSYELLDDAAREAYRRIAVFAAPFDLAAAEAVATSERVSAEAVVDLVDQLVAHSLLFVETGDATVRYRILETMQVHGRDLLEAGGETHAVNSALLVWAINFAREANAKLQGDDQQRWVDRLVLDVDNLRTALRWAIDHDPVAGLSLTVALGNFWWLHGVDRAGVSTYRSTSFLSEGRRWIRAMLDAAGAEAPPRLRARAQMTLGGLLQVRLGECDDAMIRLAEARELFSQVDDVRGEAWATFYFGVVAWGILPDEELPGLFQRALELHRASGDAAGVGLAELLHGFSLLRLGRSDEAVAGFDRFCALADETGIPNLVVHAAATRPLFARARGEAISPVDLAFAVDRFIDVGQFACLAHTVQAVALWQQVAGHSREAAKMLGVAQHLREELGTVTPAYEQFDDFVEDAGLRAVDPSLRDSGFQDGYGMALDAGVAAVQQLVHNRR